MMSTITTIQQHGIYPNEKSRSKTWRTIPSNQASTSRLGPEIASSNDSDSDPDDARIGSLSVKEELQSKPDLCRSETGSRCISPGVLSDVSDSDMEGTMDLYFNVEIGVASDLQQRDKTLSSLAVVKHSVAKSEQRLAKYRMKELSLIQRLHAVHENLAQKRQLQADLNIDRLGHYFKASRSRTNGVRGSTGLSEVLSTLARPTESFL